MSKSKINQLNDMLIDSLVRDLKDPDKCTPGLYTVIRGIVNDNRESVDGISKEALSQVEQAMANAAPFKMRESVI